MEHRSLEVVRPFRLEERGEMSKVYPQTFCLIFETAPVWLTALRSTQVKNIYMLGYTSFSNLNCCLQQLNIDIGLYNHFITSLGRTCFSFSPPSHHVTYLISGTIPFLNEQAKWLKNKKGIFITDQHTRFRRTLPGSLLQFKRTSHSIL